MHGAKVDRHRATLAEAIGRQPGCTIAVTGHGWPGYDSDRTVSQNLADLNIPCDVLLIYQTASDYLHNAVRSVDALRCVLLYDCYATDKRAAEVDAVEPQIIFHTHANDADRLTTIAPRAKHVHLPFGVDKAAFYCDDYGDRPIDCLLVGQTHAEIYPLRARWKKLVESGAIPGEIRKMPSYRLEPTQCVRQYAEWGEHMRRAKIVLIGSSNWKYPLQVYYAAAMCGCLVVADMPDDDVYQQTLGTHQVVVDPSAPDEVLAGIVSHTLRNELEIRQRGIAARNTAAELYTTDDMAEQFVAACRDML